MTTAKILADSVNEHGQRLVTYQVRAPRLILAQLSKHRALSISCRSSRAVPIRKMIDEAMKDPVIPRFGRNQSGMRAEADLTGPEAELARGQWLEARDDAAAWAREMSETGVAKETVNRLLEPFGWFDAVISATDFINFFALRIHPDAQHEIRKLALAMARVYRDSKPVERFVQDRTIPLGWHLPYVTDEERDILAYELGVLKRISAARCGRVSYVPHDSHEPDTAKDLRRAEKMAAEKHSVPFEHVCRPAESPDERSGNMIGWIQMRQSMPGNVAREFDWSLVD